jgi:hypothetical protein
MAQTRPTFRQVTDLRKQGAAPFPANVKRTSLRLWQSFPNMLACNMFRCTGFQPGVRVNDGYLQGFSDL